MRGVLTALSLAFAGCAAPAAAPAPAATNQLRAGAHDVHALVTRALALELPDGGVAELPAAEAPFAFNELVPSWNVERPAGAGFRVELRVGRTRGDLWSAWYDLGTWGQAPSGTPGPARDEHGVVDVDVFRSERLFDRAQVRFAARPAADGALPRVRRVDLCFSNTTGDPTLASRHPIDPAPPRALWQRRLDVPFRSQRVEDPALAGRICSPTSVAMVLAYHGVERPTAEVAARAFDEQHDIYGGWARAVQAAFEAGVPGHVRRFRAWPEVEAEIAAGRPLVVSLRAREGELAGAPYPSTAGHLIVLTGFEGDERVTVNDPAAATPAAGVLTYARADLERVWLARGGVAYVLLPPGS